MGKRVYDPSAQYQSIRHAAKTTGQSMYFLRTGCKEGRIPHIKVGSEYRINMSRLYELLDSESIANCRERDDFEKAAN